MLVNKGTSVFGLGLPFIVIKTTGMLMDNVRRDCIEERAIVGSDNRVRAKRVKDNAGTHTTTSVPGHVWR